MDARKRRIRSRMKRRAVVVLIAVKRRRRSRGSPVIWLRIMYSRKSDQTSFLEKREIRSESLKMPLPITGLLTIWWHLYC